jgi:hypothetical protein
LIGWLSSSGQYYNYIDDDNDKNKQRIIKERCKQIYHQKERHGTNCSNRYSWKRTDMILKTICKDCISKANNKTLWTMTTFARYIAFIERLKVIYNVKWAVCQVFSWNQQFSGATSRVFSFPQYPRSSLIFSWVCDLLNL